MKRSLAIAVIAGLSSFAIPNMPAQAASGNATARHQLNIVLPEVNFSGIALADSLDFLRDVSGINLSVNWKALEEAGITKDTPITLRLRSIPTRKALQMVLAEAGGGDKLSFDIDEGVVEVTTRELADSRMYTKVYPIEDLIMEIPDFTDAPTFDLTSLSQQNSGGGGGAGGVGGVGGGGGFGGGGGGGGSGQGLFGGSSGGSQRGNNNQNPGKTKQERAQELIDLIRATIQPDAWSENGGKAAIRYFNGSLIITASRSVHEAIGGPLD